MPLLCRNRRTSLATYDSFVRTECVGGWVYCQSKERDGMESGSDAYDAMANLGAVRDALRANLRARGLETASAGLQGELYVLGEGDLARALFEFKPSAQDAMETMYQGSWSAGMPPRFAVLPSGKVDTSAMEMLEQMHVIPVLFEASPEGITFRDLDRLLQEHLKA
jgi:hypothetical protein